MAVRTAPTTPTTPTAIAPSWITVFNPIARFLLGARLPLGPNALLTVRGRSSGEPRSTPVAIIHVDGRRWIWSPWGEVHWVRNLRAAGEATLTVRGRTEAVHAVELDRSERVWFFRDVLGPYARALRGGTAFVRLVDGVDLSRPAEEIAEDRRAFELVAKP
jgi:deazaflavin-dependent oxidoreductase (nitroreductase family)